MDVDHRTTSELRGELRTKLATHPKEAKRAQREVWIPLRNGEASTWPRGKVGSASADAGQQAGKANPPDDQEHESSIV